MDASMGAIIVYFHPWDSGLNYLWIDGMDMYSDIPAGNFLVRVISLNIHLHVENQHTMAEHLTEISNHTD